MARLALRVGALGYLMVLVVLPLGMVFRRAFEHGLGPAWDSITSPDALHALELTLEATAIAVVANTVFGVLCAIWLARHPGPLARLVDSLLDLPLAVSPVIVGVALILVYGRTGWLGGWLSDHGVQVIFAMPGIVLATIFVSLPFVVRQLVPVLRELGVEQEEAAYTLGARAFATFRRVTLPAIRPALAFGVVLTTARALGEFGAVSVVSGHIVGQTQTMTLLVQDRFEQFDVAGAYAASVVLALFAFAVLLAMGQRTTPATRKERQRDDLGAVDPQAIL